MHRAIHQNNALLLVDDINEESGGHRQYIGHGFADRNTPIQFEMQLLNRGEHYAVLTKATSMIDASRTSENADITPTADLSDIEKVATDQLLASLAQLT